jgi:CheY-like chemotaxis protein
MGRRENGENNYDAGVDLAKEIRQMDPNVPFFIFCSRRGKDRFEQDAIDAGANGVTASGFQLFNWLSEAGRIGKL